MVGAASNDFGTVSSILDFSLIPELSTVCNRSWSHWCIRDILSICRIDFTASRFKYLLGNEFPWQDDDWITYLNFCLTKSVSMVQVRYKNPNTPLGSNIGLSSLAIYAYLWRSLGVRWAKCASLWWCWSSSYRHLEGIFGERWVLSDFSWERSRMMQTSWVVTASPEMSIEQTDLQTVDTRMGEATIEEHLLENTPIFHVKEMKWRRKHTIRWGSSSGQQGQIEPVYT